MYKVPLYQMIKQNVLN